MVLKAISPDCGVHVSLMLFFFHCNISKKFKLFLEGIQNNLDLVVKDKGIINKIQYPVVQVILFF